MTYFREVDTTSRLSSSWTKLGVASNPTTVALEVTTPAGSVTTYTYAGGGVTRPSTGNFYRDVLLNVLGTWSFKWTAGGYVNGVDQGTILVYDPEEGGGGGGPYDSGSESSSTTVS